MRFLTVLLSTLLSIVSASTLNLNTAINLHYRQSINEIEYQKLFSEYLGQFNKNYSDEPQLFFKRFNIFKQNLDLVRHHNTQSVHSHRLGVTQFLDQTPQEFKDHHLRPIQKNTDNNSNSTSSGSAMYNVEDEDLPSSVDWRTTGAVGPIQNEGQCGSTYAFGSLDAVEAAWQISTGKYIVLSEQQVMDCSTPQGNAGCSGGFMTNTYQFIIDNGGIASEADYGYSGSDGTCKKNVPSSAHISSYVNITEGDEKALLQAVAKGVVSVAVEADTTAFQFYVSGILKDPSCGTNLDHVLSIVGYGTENGVDYWIARNQWGTTWGEGGYIRLARGINQCGVASLASYPVV